MEIIGDLARALPAEWWELKPDYSDFKRKGGDEEVTVSLDSTFEEFFCKEHLKNRH